MHLFDLYKRLQKSTSNSLLPLYVLWKINFMANARGKFFVYSLAAIFRAAFNLICLTPIDPFFFFFFFLVDIQTMKLRAISVGNADVLF